MRVWALDIRNHETVKESEPSICRRKRVAESSISEIRALGVREGSLLTSREAKLRRDQGHPSEEDRWQRSKDRRKCRRDPGFGSCELGGSQGEDPRVGCSKSRSCEIARSGDSCWIQVTGGPLDQEPHHISCIRGFGG
jgi:hypothetical protein